MEDDIYNEMQIVQRDINKILGRSYSKGLGIRTPVADIEETDKDIIAMFELPGVDKNNIQLHVAEDFIEVKVEKRTKAKTEKKSNYYEERSYSGFYRKLSLPAQVLPEKSKALYKDGVLKVTMLKSKTSKKKTNRISVQ
jgi:HSP20 family protein